MKMKAAVLYEQGLPRPYAKSQPLKIEEVELEAPGDQEVLVEFRGAGLCHSDISAIEGVRPRPLPFVPGHEAAGIVREVGRDVANVRPGDHVVMSFVASCGDCYQCNAGRPNLCDTSWAARTSGGLISGARRLKLNGEYINHQSGVSCFAEYGVVSRHAVVKIDDDIPLEDAALFGCAVVTGVGAVVNTAKVPPGATMAVVGLGGVGLNALLGGVVSGARRIIAIDLNDAKLGLARQLGATETFSAADPDCVAKVVEATQGGVEFAFEVAGSVEAMAVAYGVTRRGGTTVTCGITHPSKTFAFQHVGLVSDEKTIKGSFMGSCVPRRDVPRFLALYRQGKLPVDRLRSGNVKLEDLNVAFDRLADGEVVRQILVCH